MNDELQFLDSHHDASMSPLARAIALDSAADARSVAAERAKEAQRRAAAEERLEGLTLANHLGGDPLGEIRRLRAVAVEADDRVRDLEAQLEKATAKRARTTEALSALTAQVDEINRAVASRSSAPDGDMLAPAREALAAHREFVAETRRAWQAAQNGTPGPRPFVSRGRAVRGEMCPECAAVGASEAESFLIHQDPAPEQVPADFDGSELAAYPWQGEDAEHRRAGRYAESVISR